ncbi:uncharacterized protein LOC128884041 isoform X2 [Hylaeus volcanicus]|uniref:uncharacterized protein LOC128884041 isoform X2 n=1 Tax=Hylaeus volcanicus TaxID=313075 RepID=UPI0023B869F0|nr:uncharacterized protein LOC128884041 isoform X2 [Hylaeus volcanicus]
MDSRLTALAKKLKSYIVDPTLVSEQFWNETYGKKHDPAKEGVKEDNIEDLQFLARQTNDTTWMSLADRWKKAPLDLKWLCICTKDKVWLAYKSLYLQAPLDLRYISVLTHDPRWLHNCRTWCMTCMEQRLLGIARRDPAVARPNESAMAFDSMIDRLEKKLSVDEDFTTLFQRHTETLPYDISSVYPPKDQAINLKFKMKINSINNELPPYKHAEQKDKDESHTQSMKNDSPPKPTIKMLNKSLQISSKEGTFFSLSPLIQSSSMFMMLSELIRFLALKNNLIKDNMSQPQLFSTKTDIENKKTMKEGNKTVSLSKRLDSKKKTLTIKTDNHLKKQNNTVEKFEEERKHEQLKDNRISSATSSRDIPVAKTLNSLIKKLSKTIESMSSSDSISSSSVSSQLLSNQLSSNFKATCSDSDTSLRSSRTNLSSKNRKNLVQNVLERLNSQESNDSREHSVNSDSIALFSTPKKHLNKIQSIKKQSESSAVKKATPASILKSEKTNTPMVFRLETKHVTQPKMSTLPSLKKIKQSKSITFEEGLRESPMQVDISQENDHKKNSTNEMENEKLQKSVDFKSVQPPLKTIKKKDSSAFGKTTDVPKFKAKILPLSKVPQLPSSLEDSQTNTLLEETHSILNETKVAPPRLLLKKEAHKKIAPKPPPKLA